MVKIQVNSQGKAYSTTSGKVLAAVDEQPVINQLNITPSTSAQIINTTTGVDGYAPVNVSAVTSNIDTNITAENIKKNVTILGVTGTYEGSGSGTIDVNLTRFSDDNGNEIGTHYMNFIDSNGDTFKVICLDKSYRATDKVFMSANEAVVNMPEYNNLGSTNVWEAGESATTNGNLILAHCASKSRNSSGVEWCRSKSFTINGITYYGQLPNLVELVHMFKHRTSLNNMDNASSGQILTNGDWWSSSQCTGSTGWYLSQYGWIYNTYNASTKIVAPVLEIPA